MIQYQFDGEPMTTEPGRTVAAALLASGHRAWRTTRGSGEPRGAFCGIGVCFDCLVTVNDIPDQRACLTEIHPGDIVTTQIGAGRADLTC